jgi:hypothetical protein
MLAEIKYTTCSKKGEHIIQLQQQIKNVFNNSMEQRPFYEADSRSASHEITYFNGAKGCSLCSQKPDTRHYPQPDKTSPHPPTPFP